MSRMLYHEIHPYKMWFMLTSDQKAMEKKFESGSGSAFFMGRTHFDPEKGWVGITLNPEHIDNFPDLAAVLAHEIGHCVAFVFEKIGAFPEDGCGSTMEPWCYLTEHLMEVSIRWLGYE